MCIRDRFPAVNGYFFIPNYPTVVAAINFDRTGTTRIGKYVLNLSLIHIYVTTFMKVLLCNLGRQTEHGALEVGTGCAIAQNHIGHTNQHLTGVDKMCIRDRSSTLSMSRT